MITPLCHSDARTGTLGTMTTGTPHPTAPKRSRARTFVPLAIAAWAVLEIWLLTVVAGAAGGFTVLLLLVAGIVLGAAVMKRAGRRPSATSPRRSSGCRDSPGPPTRHRPPARAAGATAS